MTGEEPRFSYVLPLASELAVERALLAEKHGFDGVWLPDHFTSWSHEVDCPEPWITLTRISEHTRRIGLGVAVTDSVRRHPAVTAHSAATLDRSSSGRVWLGIGAGEDMNIEPFGIDNSKPVSRLVESIYVVKKLWDSSPTSPLDYEGRFFKLKNAFLQIHPKQKPHPPVYLGAGGPRTRKLAGEIADGWLAIPSTPPEVYREYANEVRTGFSNRSAPEGGFDFVSAVYSAVTGDVQSAMKFLDGPARSYLILSPDLLKRYGLGHMITEGLSVKNVIATKDVLERMGSLQSQLPADRIERMVVGGSVDDCIDRIEEYVSAGATHIAVNNLDGDMDRTLRSYSEKIIPYFRGK